MLLNGLVFVLNIMKRRLNDCMFLILVEVVSLLVLM